jgi:fucose permease
VLAVPGALSALWAGTIGTGLSLAVVFPATLSLAGRYMRISGSVNSWFFAGASIGGMALPWAIGQLYERAGPRVTFALVAADLVASGIVLAAIVLWLRNVGGRPQGTRR